MRRAEADRRYPWLEEQISAGATIVTASRRLARDLVDVYAARRIDAGLSAWQTPAIYYWSDWLLRTFAAADEPGLTPRRLDNLSASILWERCLRGRIDEGVLNFAGVVRQAVRAWQRLGEWNVPVPALVAAASTDDERLFAAAAADYAGLLQENQWVDLAGIAECVARALTAEPALGPDHFALAGFDRHSPAIARIIAVLAGNGCVVSELPAAERNRDVGIASFPDTAAELRAAGAWARRALQADSTASIAIVCPGLEADAEDIARLVREGLVPGWQYGGSQHRAAANLSYGRRLTEYPAIAVAILLLRWVGQGLPGPDLSILLRSGYIGPVERGGRSRLELALRALPSRDWTADVFRSAIAAREDSPDAQAFVALVDEVVAMSGEQVGQRLTPTECVQKIDALLTKAGWPGAAPLDSAGFQLVNRWRELLNDFAHIETVVERLSWSEAVGRIAVSAGDTIWQPETRTGAVQILGTLEAFGMEFDGIRVCGMDATQWPPSAGPLPFVSRALQRERGMPDATPADTLGFATRQLQRLTGAAPVCALSWPESRQDAELTMSTLLDAVPKTPLVDDTDPGWSATTIIGSADTETIDDDPAPPVEPDERVRGGAYTVQRQYTEPFAAFVHGRLGIRTADPFWTGLSPSMRGNIIHNALHNLLAGQMSQPEIAAWSVEERLRRIGSATDAALERHGRHADPVLQRIIGLERRRLQGLLDDFLNSELQRPGFTVLEVEKALDYECNGVTLGFQIDRVDRLADGRLLVLDYKTGATKSFLAQSGELKDMQLVAYADALGADVAGLLFINVDPREIALRGAGEGWRDGDDPDWADTLLGWKTQLHEVVAALAAGDARIDVLKTAAEGRTLGILSRLEEYKRAR